MERMIKTTLKLHVSKSSQSRNFKCQWNVAEGNLQRQSWGKTEREISSTGKLEECHSIWHRHSTSKAMRTSSTSHPDIQAIIYQWSSDHCLSLTPESTPLTIASSPVTSAWIHQLGEHQTRACKLQDEHKYTQATNTTVGEIATCPKTGHKGLSGNRKGKHGTCHRQGLKLWLWEPTKPLLHNT